MYCRQAPMLVAVILFCSCLSIVPSMRLTFLSLKIYCIIHHNRAFVNSFAENSCLHRKKITADRSMTARCSVLFYIFKCKHLRYPAYSDKVAHCDEKIRHEHEQKFFNKALGCHYKREPAAERHHHCLLEYRHKQITEIYCCGFQDQHNKSGSHHIERCDLLVIISEYSKDKIIIVYLFYIITASPINVIAPAIFPVAGTLNGASAI